ncbi:MAG: polysaccharide pyruvyl transferase family protein [Ginsengibacter sp.]
MKFYYDLKKWAKDYVTLAKGKKPNHANKTDNFYSIGLIDQSICSQNLGDNIISEAVTEELKSIFSFSYINHFPGQINSSIDYTRLLSAQDFIFVGGTNLLKSNMNKNPQWKINSYSKFFLKNRFILMGVGWFQYQSEPNSYSVSLLKDMLSNKFLHSVRDSYTEKKLHSIGIKNVINTTCPTLWQIDNKICSNINIYKSNNVVTTLTSYYKDPEVDKKILNILCENYKKVYLWLQGFNDYQYFKNLSLDNQNIIVLDSSLTAYENILSIDDIEYIGSRLHGGIKALKKGKRTLILAVDNRAYEIKIDTNLNVIKRSDYMSLLLYLEKPYHTLINLPVENIKRWKEQFL